jgi:translation initiation factor 3 subunit M
VNYIVRNQSDEERAAFIRPFQDVLKTAEGQKPLEQDEERRRKIFAMAIKQVKGFGDGTEKGVLFACQCSDDTERSAQRSRDFST